MKGRALLIYGLLCAPLVANGPGAAAIGFLEKVKFGKIDLEPGGDTAVQENTVKEKLLQIRRGIENLETDLSGGTLELGKIREEGDYAAVMVTKTGGFDSAHLQMFPVALIKRGAEWVPAPVLASFENAVAGYTTPLRERLNDLEGWMSRERVLGLQTLVSESSERSRKMIRDNIVGEDLEGEDLGKITGRFIEACASGNRAAVLGFLGGLSDPLPEDWEERLRASKMAVVQGDGGKSAWRMVTSPQVVRVVVNKERSADSGLVSLACLDPERAAKAGQRNAIGILHLEFSKDAQGRWMIDLPSMLLEENAPEQDLNDSLDADLLNRFPKELRKSLPARHSSDFNLAREETITRLRSSDLRDLFSKVDLSGTGRAARAACGIAASYWWSFNAPTSFKAPVYLGSREQGEVAVAAYQWFSPTDPDRFELKTLFFKKSADGWLWAPGFVSKDENEEHEMLVEWIAGSEGQWRLTWRR